MQQTVWICDKCGEVIKDEVFSVSFRSEKIEPNKIVANSASLEASMARFSATLDSIKSQTNVHLCKSCMDKFTDGMCIVR